MSEANISKQTDSVSTIYIFNARDDTRYMTMKECFKLTDDMVNDLISEEFELLCQRLSVKNIKYDELKGALIPNQDKKKFETCFVFDSSQIDDDFYGDYIFDKLLPLLDKKSTFSVLCGDYIDILNNDVSSSQVVLHTELNKVLNRCNKSTFQHSGQYFLVYFNRLTGNQRWHITEELMKYTWFTGFADVSHPSKFKSYISFILTHSFIKNKNKIICSHPEDEDDESNINMSGLPFENHGFEIKSINDNSFGPFLSYKIESNYPDKIDVGFSFNVLFPKFDSLDKLKLTVDDVKWNEYLTKEKGEIIKSLGFSAEEKDRFIQEVYNRIMASYIYKLERKNIDGINIWKFCVCIDMSTVNGHFRKTTVALNYFPQTGEMRIITIT